MSFGSPYNIDALRRADGSYSDASVKIINGALRCGHTAHLQTGLGIVAIRPFTLTRDHLNGPRGEKRHQLWPMDEIGQNWLVEFQPTHDSMDKTEYRGNDIREAAAFIYRSLNGRAHRFEVGMLVNWYSNQANRDAEVLAVLDDLVLIEYEMPGTTSGREHSALVICKGEADRLSHHRNVTHRKLPKKWIAAMHDQGTCDWIGMGQRERDPVPFPAI